MCRVEVESLAGFIVTEICSIRHGDHDTNVLDSEDIRVLLDNISRQ